MSNATQLCDIGLVGLGVMGKNLGLNLADNGYSVAAFDLDHAKIDGILAQDKAERGEHPQRIFACSSFTELLSKLKKPHLIILSVPAGAPVDSVCENLIGAGLQPDDIVVDTGNSLWSDTIEREAGYKGKFIFFTTAVSGGEVGARFGPSLMPSGDPYAWTRIEPVLQAISAKVDPETGLPIESQIPGEPVTEGDPCACYIGPAGSGHYVKMVHNGIEYADMQLICEAYHFMREALDMTPKAIASTFREWNKGALNSYLIEISAEVLEQDDPLTGQPIVDVILDKAGQKGTGLWTAVSSLQIGTPATTIAQAVYARAISSLKEQRVKAASILAKTAKPVYSETEKQVAINQLHDALYCSKICAYAQGFDLMKMAAIEYNWKLDFAAIAKIWRAGCIIRAVFLQSITDAYNRDENLDNLMLDSFFSEQLSKFQDNWREALIGGIRCSIPMPSMTSALSYFDSYKTATLPANLLQGQRDFFGAHTFKRVDQKSSNSYHIEWSNPERPLQEFK